MNKRIIDNIKEHKLFLALFVIFVLIRLPLAGKTHEFLMMDQDYNPTNFGLLYLHGDLPAADDVDVGENARYLSLSSAYYYVPLIFYKLGVPFEFFYALHLVLGLPLFLMGIYLVAYAVYRNPIFATFAALFFYMNRWIFDLNIGYPLLFDREFYYGDINHIPAAFFVAFFLMKKPVCAGLSSFALTLLNPTYGVSSALVLFLDLLRRFVGKIEWKRTAAACGISTLGMAIAFVMVKLATPINMPVAREVRDLCIRMYGHFTPHIFNMQGFINNAFILLAVLIFAGIYERYLRNGGDGEAKNNLSGEIYVFIALFTLFGLAAYFFLYVYNAELFIMVTPSKSWLLVLMVVGAYVSLALYKILHRNIWSVSVVFILLYLNLLWKNNGHLVTEWPSYEEKLLLALAAVLAAAGFAIAGRNAKFKPSHLAIAVAIVALTGMSIWQMNQLKSNPRLRFSSALYRLELEIKDKLPKDAMITAYRVPGSRNPYGPFTNWPIRTYSRRGGLLFWVMGRNAYFNSQMLMEREQKVFSAAGLDLWPALLKESSRQLQEDPAFYYFGLSISPSFKAYKNTTPPLAIFNYVGSMYGKWLSSLDFDAYLLYMKKIGATHVVICRDPVHRGPDVKPVIENEFFAVVEVPK